MGGCINKEKPTNTDTTENNGDSYDKLMKIVFVGDVNVGKSSIILRYTEDVFTGIPVTSVGDNGQKIKMVDANKSKIKLQIWDTEGSERYRVITVSYYRSASVAIIVFDLTNPESFKNVEHWVKDIKDQSENIRFVLIGNKTDENDRQVSEDEARKYAEDNYFPYFETSAKNGTGIEEAMQHVIQDLLE